jgi:hypothetical protein
MNPKRFLALGGSVLIILGVLGITGLLGRISSASFFNPPYGIHWVHLTLGVVVFLLALSPYAALHAWVTLFPAIVGTTMGILGLILGSWAAGRSNNPQLADPSDHLAHLILGAIAIWAWRNRSSAAPS